MRLYILSDFFDAIMYIILIYKYYKTIESYKNNTILYVNLQY